MSEENSIIYKKLRCFNTVDYEKKDGYVSNALEWDSGALGSDLSSATDFLYNLGQVTQGPVLQRFTVYVTLLPE